MKNKINKKKLYIAVDIGNTNIDFSVFCGRKLVSVCKYPSSKPDMFLAEIKNIVCSKQYAQYSIKILLASVNPPVTHYLDQMIRTRFKISPILAGRDFKIPMPVLLDEPSEAGIDRLLNAYLAYKIAGKSAVVVDFGTAITFDCISDKGEFLGGVITPGIMLSANTLSERCSLLPPIEPLFNTSVIGKNTVEAMNIGLYQGAIGMINHLLERIILSFNKKPAVYVTGGDGKKVFQYIKTADKFIPNFTVRALMEAFKEFYEKS